MSLSANNGMRTDLIINPHAVPSRMKIVLLIESIAAKVNICFVFLDGDKSILEPIDERRSKGIRIGDSM